MKKMISLFVAVAMMLSLVACGTEPASTIQEVISETVEETATPSPTPSPEESTSTSSSSLSSELESTRADLDSTFPGITKQEFIDQYTDCYMSVAETGASTFYIDDMGVFHIDGREASISMSCRNSDSSKDTIDSVMIVASLGDTAYASAFSTLICTAIAINTDTQPDNDLMWTALEYFTDMYAELAQLLSGPHEDVTEVERQVDGLQFSLRQAFGGVILHVNGISPASSDKTSPAPETKLIFDETGFLVSSNEFMKIFNQQCTNMPDVGEHTTTLRKDAYDSKEHVIIDRDGSDSFVALSFAGNDNLNNPMGQVAIFVDYDKLMNNYTSYRSVLLNILGMLPYVIDSQVTSVEDGSELIISLFNQATIEDFHNVAPGGAHSFTPGALPTSLTQNGITYTLYQDGSNLYISAAT